jgi:flavin-dependent dehydrogenase
MIGDSARVIAPLAGDGIGMAMESAKLLYEIIKKHSESLNLASIQTDYQKKYNQMFIKRLTSAKIIQKILLNRLLQINSFRFVKRFPFLLPHLIKFTRSSQIS